MYKTIMVPVDLTHADRLTKALATAADLAERYQATVHYAAVTAETPTEIAHNPTEFAQKLGEFAAKQAAGRKFEAKALPLPSHDPTTDLDKTLAQAAKSIGCDLVVMASHIPGLTEYFVSSNAGWLGAHLDISVFIVR